MSGSQVSNSDKISILDYVGDREDEEMLPTNFIGSKKASVQLLELTNGHPQAPSFHGGVRVTHCSSLIN